MKESKSAEVDKLKKQVRKLQKEKRQLISKLNTLEQAFRENLKFLKGATEDKSLEELIEAAKKRKPLKEINNPCPVCGNELLISKGNYGEIHTCGCGYRNKK